MIIPVKEESKFIFEANCYGLKDFLVQVGLRINYLEGTYYVLRGDSDEENFEFCGAISGPKVHLTELDLMKEAVSFAEEELKKIGKHFIYEGGEIND